MVLVPPSGTAKNGRMVSLNDVYRARRRLSDHLEPTPLLSYPALDAIAGTEVFVKHENLQPIGAFKVRGGINLLATMDSADRNAGIVGYSTGNHAQSLAYAARRFGVECVIVVPADPNPVKAAAVRALGAHLVEYGPHLETAAEHAAGLARSRGMRLVSAADEPALIAGVATAYLEVFTELPDVDVVLVPVGSGTGAAGACVVAEALNPDCRVVGVQSDASPAAHDSWRAGELVTRPNLTVCDGLTTGAGFGLPQRMLRGRLADFRLVSDAEIAHAQWLLLSRARTVAEGAGAAATAALSVMKSQLAGQRVVVMCTGGNAAEAELRRCVDQER